MLDTQFFEVRKFGLPSTFLHYSLGPENGFFITFIAEKAEWVFYQVAVFNVPPVTSVADTRDFPDVSVKGTGNELTNLD
ncbi:hypothetical protein [Desulfosarcina cetonica]|uniref:hypothetical protein n=1 Tax=Desulfosarcina cetonica TaxID=90730 RepID=UPI0012ED9D0C|nr:hypothetical protein [Desulfosarcina cetonica]